MDRILRRMGLPGWTFLGVAVSATIVFYGGKAIEQIVESLFEGFSLRAKNLLVALVLVSLGCVPILLAWLYQKQQRSIVAMHIIGGDLRQPRPRRGVILLVSNPNSVMHSIKYHFLDNRGLQFIWLIPSNDEEQEKFGPPSIALAQEIKQQCKSLAKAQGGVLEVSICDPVSPADAQDTFECVNRIFRISDLKAHEIIADFTGGTKPMTVGMIMACLPRERELEYVPYNPQTKQMNGPYLVNYHHSAFDLVG